MTSKEIFDQYPSLPRKFLAQFAYDCVVEVKDKINIKEYKDLLEVIGLWLKDEATTEEVSRAKEIANAPAPAAAHAAAVAVNAPAPAPAAVAAFYAYYTADAAIAAANASASSVAYATADADNYKAKLKSYAIDLQRRIDQLSEFEKILYSKDE
jgi:hypothetical protein